MDPKETVKNVDQVHVVQLRASSELGNEPSGCIKGRRGISWLADVSFSRRTLLDGVKWTSEWV